MSIFDKYDLIDVDETFPIPDKPKSGVIALVGSSGSGKTTIMREWGFKEVSYSFDVPVYQLFSSENEAEKHLLLFGLRSIPTWKRSLSELSNGEKQRAIFALNYSRGNFFCDEFTSLVDRNTAQSLCHSINKAKPKNLIVASCHADISEFLKIDYLYDCDKKKWGFLWRQSKEMRLEIKPSDPKETWGLFRKHHYLSGKINKSCICYVAYLDGKPVAMTSFLAFPNGNFKNGWRGHRTVVLPEFQGMGIGNALSDWVADKVTSSGGRFFSKTSHPSMGEHRESSTLWKATSKNRMKRKDYTSSRNTKEDKHKMMHAHRLCYSHEYIGNWSDVKKGQIDLQLD